MFQTGQVSFIGGLSVLAILLVTAIVLGWFGASLGEALYLSIVLVTSLMYCAYHIMLHRSVQPRSTGRRKSP